MAQLYAEAVGQTLHMVNCHQHTETADFIGGLRPARGRSANMQTLRRRLAAYEADTASFAAAALAAAASDLPDARSDLPDLADASLAQLEQRLERATARLVAGRSALTQVAAAAPASAPGTTLPAAARAGGVNSGPASAASGEALAEEGEVLRELAESCRALFLWEDG